MAENYVYLKNLQGTVIKPRTELGAVDMTTVNGIAVTDNTIGIMDGYVESAYYMNMVEGTSAANPDSAYIEGGTMFQLIGGYTVSDEIPPAVDADPYKIPSELSVRSAIDAIATLGPSLTPGAGIVVTTVPGSTGGILSVAEGNGISVNTAQTGGVSVKTATSGGLSVDSNGVAVNVGSGMAVDGSNNINVVAKTSGGLVVDSAGVGVVAGDTIDLAGGTVNAKVAEVGEVLTGLVSGSTVGDKVEEVTPDNLRGALSVGQAVDVSCAPTEYSDGWQVSLDGSEWVTPTQQYMNDNYLSTFYIKTTRENTSIFNFGFWNNSTKRFPKYAPGLKYLFIADFCNYGAALDAAQSYIYGTGANVKAVKGFSLYIPNAAEQSSFTRIAATFEGAEIRLRLAATVANTEIKIELKNWRQYEVTALTDEAIAYIAQLPDPDAFFRSTSAYSIRDKYLIKQDMVCPFIPTINMPDNSDLTVAAGLSYKIKYTNDNTHTITADTIPTDAYGWDTHIQMFIKGTSAINFQKPLVLMDALTPNAGHNLSVKWRNGDALVYVDDTNAGNIVISTSGTTAGTLNYYLLQDPGSGQDNYIIFGAATDGAVCDAGTVSVAYNTDILGNGTDKTTITGTYNVVSGKTMNLQDLAVSGSTFGGVGTTNFVATSIVSDTEVISGGTVNFSGTNTLDATLSGAGKLVFSANSTLVSVGGLGTISNTATNTLNDNVTFSDITITGRTTGYGAAISSSVAGRLNLINCVFTNNKATSGSGGVLVGGASSNITITGCTFSGNSAYYNNTSVLYTSGQLYAKNCVLLGSVVQGITVNANTTYIENIVLQNGKVQHNAAGTVVLVAGSTVDSTGNQPSTYLIHGTGTLILQDNITIIGYDGTIASVDALKCKGMDTDRRVGSGDITITGSTKSVWSASNVLFGYKIDASETYTVKFSGTKFTGGSKIFNANRIQLPASTTISFQGNTNAADTKILDASLIVVGDNLASPSGFATVVNASGTSSTVTGIGTYIDKEGDNDFVANNTTNVKAVDASITGAKYLGTVLSATTGDTGANRFAKIDSGAVAVVNEATNAVNKQIITHDYEPILGGTFSLTSATVDEATKTVAIQSGGNMSVVDVRGGKDSVIDLGQTRVSATSPVVMSGVTVTNGHAYGENVVLKNGGGLLVHRTSAFISSCVFSSNHADRNGGAISTETGGYVTVTDCVFEDNTADFGRTAIHLASPGTGYTAVLNISNCVFKSGQNIYTGGTTTLEGSNSLLGTVAGVGSAIIASGAILDLTGNTNATPINPTGGITFEQGGATVYPSAGATSAYSLGGMTVPKLGNTNVVNLGGTNVHISNGTITSASGCVFSGGSASYLGGAILVSSGALFSANGCTFSGNYSNQGGAIGGMSATIKLSSCTITGNTAVYIGALVCSGGSAEIIDCNISGNTIGQSYNGVIYARLGASVTLSGCTVDHLIHLGDSASVVTFGGSNSVSGVDGSGSVTISGGAIVDLTSSIAPGGGITVLEGGCAVNGNAIPAGTYTSINSNGQPT